MYMLITPANINEARRLANSYAKAEEIIKEGYQFTFENSGSIAVCKPGRLAASYWIVDGECDCPDFLNRGTFCKHTLANRILREEEESLEAQCAEYDLRQLMEW